MSRTHDLGSLRGLVSASGFVFSFVALIGIIHVQ
jgi:hypothetical protein